MLFEKEALPLDTSSCRKAKLQDCEMNLGQCDKSVKGVPL